MNKEIEHLTTTNEKALEYFQQELIKSKKALDYLNGRKISEALTLVDEIKNRMEE